MTPRRPSDGHRSLFAVHVYDDRYERFFPDRTGWEFGDPPAMTAMTGQHVVVDRYTGVRLLESDAFPVTLGWIALTRFALSRVEAWLPTGTRRIPIRCPTLDAVAVQLADRSGMLEPRTPGDSLRPPVVPLDIDEHFFSVGNRFVLPFLCSEAFARSVHGAGLNGVRLFRVWSSDPAFAFDREAFERWYFEGEVHDPD